MPLREQNGITALQYYSNQVVAYSVELLCKGTFYV